MSDGFKFGDLLKPGEAARLGCIRELETRRDKWTAPGYVYRGAGDFLLRHGRHFPPPPTFPDPYTPNEYGTCFVNALEHSEATGLRYCEGLYATADGYIAHAWCLTPEDRVLELTMPSADDPNFSRYITEAGTPFLPHERWCYWGCVFPVEFIRWHAEQHLDEDGAPTYSVFDRTPYEAERSLRLFGTERMFSVLHDFPLGKVPFDPARTTL